MHVKLCEEKFRGRKKSFSWLGQKVIKKIDCGDAYGHDDDDCGLDLCPWPRDHVTCRQDISTVFNILIDFEANEYSCLIQCSICI